MQKPSTPKVQKKGRGQKGQDEDAMKAITLMAALAALLLITALSGCGGQDQAPAETAATSPTTVSGAGQTRQQEPEPATQAETEATPETAKSPAPLPEKTARPTAEPEPTDQAQPTADPGRQEQTNTPEPIPTTAGQTGQEQQPTEAPLTRTVEEPWVSEYLTFDTPTYETGREPNWEEMQGIIAATSHATTWPVEVLGEECLTGIEEVLRAFAVVDPDGKVILLKGASGVSFAKWVRDTEARIVPRIHWESSNEQVASFNEHRRVLRREPRLQCNQTGTTTITAKFNDTEASVTLTVLPEPTFIPKGMRACRDTTDEGIRWREHVLVQMEPWPHATANYQRASVIAEDTASVFGQDEWTQEAYDQMVDGKIPIELWRASDIETMRAWPFTKGCQTVEEQDDFIKQIKEHQ